MTTTSVPRRPPTGFIVRMTGLTARTGGATIVRASDASRIDFMANAVDRDVDDPTCAASRQPNMNRLRPRGSPPQALIPAFLAVGRRSRGGFARPGHGSTAGGSDGQGIHVPELDDVIKFAFACASGL